MHDLVNLNGMTLPASDVSIAGTSSAALYGKGIFTTLAIFGGKPFLWEQHCRRLRRDSDRCGLSHSDWTDGELGRNLANLVDLNGVAEGRARITIFDESATQLWPANIAEKVSILITTAARASMWRVAASATIALGFSPFPADSQSPLAGVKSCNYLANLIALDEVRKRGFNEAVRLNERGVVTSACMANIFWISGDQLFTPSLSTGCVAGTTREIVLERLPCEEVEARLDDLNAADAVYLTSAGHGIRRATSFEARNFGPVLHPIETLVDFAPAN